MKRSVALAWIVLLCLGLMIYCIVEGSTPTAPVLRPQETQTLTDPSTQPPRISIWVQDPMAGAAWEELAVDYSAVSGAEVAVVEDAQDAALLILEDAAEVARWSDHCLDLSGTVAYAQLVNWDLAARLDGKVCGIPTQMEGFGLICNTQLLASAYSLSEIGEISKLKEVVEHITTAGMTAFAPSDPDIFTAFVASLPEDSRAFVDLYFANGGELSEGGLQEMLRGQAVFCLGSTAGYEVQDSAVLGILPICLGHEDAREHTLCVAGSDFLCVRGDVSEGQAVLDFLDYLVLPDEEGMVPLDRLRVLAPFRQAAYAANGAEQTLRDDLASGKECLAMVDRLPQGLTDALLTYAAEPTEENWDSFVGLM